MGPTTHLYIRRYIGMPSWVFLQIGAIASHKKRLTTGRSGQRTGDTFITQQQRPDGRGA